MTTRELITDTFGFDEATRQRIADLGYPPKLTNFTQINEIFDETFCIRDFTEFEYQIYNSTIPMTVDANNVEHLTVLTGYYNVVKNEYTFRILKSELNEKISMEIFR